MKPLYVLKIGGSVITEKDDYAVARIGAIERIAREIHEARERKEFNLVLVNGAGSFGHAPVEQYGLEDGLQEPGDEMSLGKVHKHVEDLNRKLWDALETRGVAALPVHPMSCILAEDGEFTIDTSIVEEMLRRGITPLLYGDMVMDTERGATVVSGDDLAPMLGAELDAYRVAMGSDTEGVFDRDPSSQKARLIRRVTDDNWRDVLAGVGDSGSTDVTGGMRAKLEKLVELSGGCECLIFNAELEGNVRDVLQGKVPGTKINVTA